MEFLSFSGNGEEDVALFLRKVNRIAFSEGKSRDDDWLADYVGACLAGTALDWYTELDESVRRSWGDLRPALLKQFTSRGGRPHPLAAAPPPKNPGVAQPPFMQNSPSPSPVMTIAEKREVRALLHALTKNDFNLTSDQIISWANKSEAEADGRTLMQVVRLVVEKATEDVAHSATYAKLCQKMMEQISPGVRDEEMQDRDGKPIAGGRMFMKYLLIICRNHFERGCSTKRAVVALAASGGGEGNSGATIAAAEPAGKEEIGPVPYRVGYFAAMKIKRQRLGLFEFLGELFKLQVVTERIMHECIKRLLSNREDIEDEEIESLCRVLVAVGQSLDTEKARNHMDIYFARMDILAKNPAVAPRIQYMLLDVIELRHRGWKAKQAVAAPSTITTIHEEAAKEKAAGEAEAATAYSRTSMSRGGSRRGEHARGGELGGIFGPGGLDVMTGNAARAPPAKAGDLSQFGKITKSSGMMTMGPSSVFRMPKRTVTGPGGAGSGLRGPGGTGLGPRGPEGTR
ncbi:hypothetical protein FRB96_008487 [Tulasnella sp. 330]|nr:hypothetical protein FRB96_008487 [Tulasnella sp. 330]